MTYDQALAQANAAVARYQGLVTQYRGHEYVANLNDAKAAYQALLTSSSHDGDFTLGGDGYTYKQSAPTTTGSGTTGPGATLGSVIGPGGVVIAPATNINGGSGDSTVEPVPVDHTADANDAVATIQTYLQTLGFNPTVAATLAQTAFQKIINGESQAQILLEIQGSPEFKAEFPEIQDAINAGRSYVPSPVDIINYRKQATEAFQAAGLPPSFYDTNADFSTWINGNVSISELQDRINLGKQLLYNLPPDVSTLLRAQGLSNGDLTAWILDPKVAEPLIQNKINQAQDVYAAGQSGIALTFDQAQQALYNGLSTDQVRANAATAANASQLFQNLPGEPGNNLATQQDFTIGDPTAAAKVSEVSQRRLARFAPSNSGALASTTGIEGLGKAK